MKAISALIFFAMLTTSVVGQSVFDREIITVEKPVPLVDVLQAFEKEHPVRFFYREDWLYGVTVVPEDSRKPLRQLLDEKFQQTDLSVSYQFGYAVIIIRDPTPFLQYRETLERVIESRKTVTRITLGAKDGYVPGKPIRISGIVTDNKSQNPLSGVVVMINDTESAVSNAEGRYEVSLPRTEVLLTFRLHGFEEKIIDLQAFQSEALNIVMEDNPTILDEVVFTEQSLVDRRAGEVNLSIQQIRRAPALFGEADVIRQIQQLPGVTTVGEVANGFNVRGGGVDQNLVLYDGIPVFNTAHAFGFFSAFNPDAIQSALFLRAGIPAEYGGRISSVLDISSKEGGESWHGSGGLGILSSYASIGGPIRKESTTLMASIRASYSDWILDAARSNYADLENSSASYYDASIKVAHQFNPRTKLIGSAYFSRDAFSLTNDTVYSYRNTAASLRLNHSLSDKLFMQLQLGFGSYYYNVHEPEGVAAFDLEYGIVYPSVQVNFNYEGKHKLSFGLHSTFYQFHPGELSASGSSSVARVAMPEENSLEHALYFGDEFRLNERIAINAGLRTSLYQRIGKGKLYQYEDGRPREPEYIADSVQYGAGEIMKSYLGLEPRISVTYSVGNKGSVKASYNRMNQYFHLITNTAAVTPIDIWQSSNTYFKPQTGDQFSIGYYRELKENTVEAFAEVFYKSVQNVLDFKDGAQLILNPNLETAFIAGRGTSYGIEFSVARTTGRLQGNVNYTYSRSFRKIDGPFDVEKVNRGERYPSNYDQPNIVNVSWRYGISRRYFFTGAFTYHTGRPTSLPTSAYTVDGTPILDFSDRNKYRLPDYHRLDVALVIEGTHKRKKILDGTWTISFYNAYARKNAYSVFYDDDGKGNVRPYKLSVIGTIIPSIHYSFKF